MYLSHRIAYACSILSIAASASATAHDVQNVKPTSAAPDKTTVRERDVVNTPVPVVQYGRLNVAVQSGLAEVPIAVSRDWTQPQGDVTRAVVIIPGWPRRDLRSGEHAAEVAGAASLSAIIVTPQFLTARDIAAHNLPGTVLRWRENDWPQGRPSDDVAAVSSFKVIDAIFEHLANRAIFPNLRTIVLAGHSAGGQFVQRYAVLGRGDANLGGAPIHVRYVVANPATYLYLTDQRPDSGGAFVPFSAASCPTCNHWHYGLHAGVPPYSQPQAPDDELRARYLDRDVVYLLGTADDVPDADGMDHSCGAEAQGATRYRRGLAFNAYVHMLDPRTSQHVMAARGVGHSSYRIFSSVCGRAALFDASGCDSGSE